jgi:hypothetical protein
MQRSRRQRWAASAFRFAAGACALSSCWLAEAAPPSPSAIRAGGEPEASEPAQRELEKQLIEELNQFPDDPALGAAINRFYRLRRGLMPQPLLLLAVRRAPDPVVLALRLTTPALDSDAVTASILVAALSERPEKAALWARAAGALRGAWRSAFLEEAYRRAAAGAAEDEIPAVAAMAESWLDELFLQGMPQQMLAAFEDLEPAVRALVDAGVERSIQIDLGVIYYDTVNDAARLKSDVWYQSSADGGVTFSAAVKVTSAQTDETVAGADLGNQYGGYNGLSGFLGKFFPSWTDRRDLTFEEIWTVPITDP